MRRNLKRTMIAAGLSLSCFLGTSLWYHATDSSRRSHGEQKPVAYIENVKDEIHRRPVTRIIWQLISNGEAIYPGEAIRTSNVGEVRIQFAESTRYLDVEADSLIIISQNQNQEISLDLMDGSLMVHQGADGDKGPSLSLKSGDSKVDLTKATASLSKSSNGNLDLQVLKGKVKVDSNGKQSEIESGKTGALGAKGLTEKLEDLQILSPSQEHPFSLNAEAPRPVVFQWRGFPEKSKVSVLLGASRKTLSLKAESTSNQSAISLNAGVYFWKLVGKDLSDKVLAESPVYKLEVKTRYPPVALYPAVDQRLINDGKALDFKWICQGLCENVLLEVSKDLSLKDAIISEKIKNGDSFSRALPDGEYFYRLSASFPGSEEWMRGKVQKFYLNKEAAPEIGTIAWDSKTFLSPQLYPIEPTLHLKWTAFPSNQVHHYRLKMASSEEDLSLSPKILETEKTENLSAQSMPGRYFAQVEALNEKNQIIATSSVQSVELALLPLLPAPEIFPAEGELVATPKGDLEIKWKSITGAANYKVSLIDSKGKAVRNGKFSKSSATMINLLPGEHSVQVQAIDAYGRPSEKTARIVRVPASSGLSVPKLKKLKVN